MTQPSAGKAEPFFTPRPSKAAREKQRLQQIEATERRIAQGNARRKRNRLLVRILFFIGLFVGAAVLLVYVMAWDSKVNQIWQLF